MTSFKILTGILQTLLTSANIALPTTMPDDELWLDKEEITDSIIPVDPSLLWPTPHINAEQVMAEVAFQDVFGYAIDDDDEPALSDEDTERALSLLAEDDAEFDNHRETFRVRASYKRSIEGRLLLADREIPVYLRDVSMTGFGVYIQEADLDGIAPNQIGELTLSFPDGPPSASYTIELRHISRDRIEELGVLGMQLTERRAESQADKVPNMVLRSYVMERQRERCRLRLRRLEGMELHA